jgi:hypothetical protein
MHIHDAASGASWFSKRRKRYDGNREPRELTFSCYRRFKFLERDRTREWFIAALEKARQRWPVDVWAYVLMPEQSICSSALVSRSWNWDALPAT